MCDEKDANGKTFCGIDCTAQRKPDGKIWIHHPGMSSTDVRLNEEFSLPPGSCIGVKANLIEGYLSFSFNGIRLPTIFALNPKQRYHVYVSVKEYACQLALKWK